MHCIVNRHARSGACPREAQPDAPVQMCQTHLNEVYIFVGDQIRAEFPAPETRRFDTKRPQVVYFARSGALIKIGTSRNVDLRMQTLQPEQLMGTVPGGFKEERQAHLAWAHLRERGEWFRAEPELVEWIEAVCAAS